MSNEILFSERQQFSQKWIVVLLFVGMAFQFYDPVNHVFLGNYGDKAYPGSGLIIKTNYGMIITSFCIISIALLFKFMRLDTEIREDGIYYQLFPFQFKMKKITWDEIEEIFVRRYNPIMEYGGWGIRLGLFGKGWAINIAGNKGIQIIFKDTKKRKFLIGTQKPDEVEVVLNKLTHN